MQMKGCRLALAAAQVIGGEDTEELERFWEELEQFNNKTCPQSIQLSEGVPLDLNWQQYK